MKQTMLRTIVLLLICFLLLFCLTSRATATPPPCGDCYYWDGDECVPYGNCWGGCPDCETCVNCWCTCREECCSDPGCPGCCICSGCTCTGDNSKCLDDQCYACIDCGCVYQCDPDNCQICVDGVCENRCTLDPNSCDICDGVGNCVSTCDPNTEVCCDGTCTAKCENTEPTGHCDPNQDVECPGCVGVFPFTGAYCSDFPIKEYTGNINHNCTGGCPGDCERQPDVHCHTEYECWVDLKDKQLCGYEEEGDFTYCFNINIELATCVGCQKHPTKPGVKEYVTHWACN